MPNSNPCASLIIMWLLFAQVAFGQSIRGRVVNSTNNEPVAGAVVEVQNTNLVVSADTLGFFLLDKAPSANCTLVISAFNYEAKTIYDLNAMSGKENYLEIKLKEKTIALEEVVIRGANFHRTVESPVSLKNLSGSEIERMPGGLRDVSRGLQAFPGVSAATAWRNDLIVRGGGAYENKFFLDGIPIPHINHFTPQGTSGGAYGIINPNYLKDIDFYSGAFPSHRGNALSSVIELHLKDGDPKRKNAGAVIGSTDLSLTSDGYLSKKFTYLTSLRLSNWKFTAAALGLPFKTRYDDFFVKLKYKNSPQDEWTFIGIAAIDYSEPNLDAAEGLFANKNNAAMMATINTYLRKITTTKQGTYTLGGQYQRFFNRSNLSVSLSRSFLYNSLLNHTDQRNRSEENKILDYYSAESQHTLQVQYNYRTRKNTSLLAGVGSDYLGIKADNFNIAPGLKKIDTLVLHSKFYMSQISAFFRLSHSFKKLDFAFGIRTDCSPYNSHTAKFYNQLSPRFSFSYKIADHINLNFNSGLYAQHPLTTLLCYKNRNGQYENADSLKYMKCFHHVVGLDYVTHKNLKIALEFFNKTYSNVPFLKEENLSLPNSVSFVSQQSLGLSPANSSGLGRSYGLEILLHQKFWKGHYGIFSYTLMKSEYTNQGHYLSSNWDHRHIVSVTLGKVFPRNWEIGIKFRLSSGNPYTPLDYNKSSLKAAYDLNPLGILDFSQLNSKRLHTFHALDLRAEKKYVVRKIPVRLFFDAQNVYNAIPPSPPFLKQELGANGNPLTSPQDPNKYALALTDFTPPFSILPTFGLILILN